MLCPRARVRGARRRTSPEPENLSTESIATTSQPAPSVHCATCGAPMAGDQRYCLHCGARRLGPSSILAGGPPVPAEPAAGAPLAPQGPPPPATFAQRNPWLTLIAGIGVLLLAMGVGVLIGRSGGGSRAAASPPVITVAGAGASSSAGSGEATFTGDWPAGTSGYTVELQTLPSSTTVSAVEAAKTAASGKGAKAVGALKAEEFSSIGGSGFVVYSGDFKKSSEAQTALKGLKASFPSAKVIAVNNGSSGSSSEKEPAEGSSSSGGGANLSKPAPPSVLENLKGGKGKSYEEKSKNLPNVISTG